MDSRKNNFRIHWRASIVVFAVAQIVQLLGNVPQGQYTEAQVDYTQPSITQPKIDTISNVDHDSWEERFKRQVETYIYQEMKKGRRFEDIVHDYDICVLQGDYPASEQTAAYERQAEAYIYRELDKGRSLESVISDFDICYI